MKKTQKIFKRINAYIKKEEGSIAAFPQGLIFSTMAVIAFVIFYILIKK